jgi:threonine/homoserine/homoserine lactone efflux protein
MNTPTLIAFLAASAVLAITPGPGVIYIVTRTLAQGRAAGASSVAGVACGNFLNALGASLGLAALFAVSSFAFTLVKYAGAAYLIYLGIKLLRSTPSAEASRAVTPAPVGRVFREGVLVALLNPKTTIFFAAFLPQFMHAAMPALPQALMLGAIFVAVAAASDLGYVLLATWLSPRFARAGAAPRWGRWGHYASGGALIALGVASAMAGQRNAR